MEELVRHGSKRNNKRKGVKKKRVTQLESKRKEVKRKEVTLQQGSKSKWKEEKEVVTCISLSPSNTTFTHSLSFTLMAKTKT